MINTFRIAARWQLLPLNLLAAVLPLTLLVADLRATMDEHTETPTTHEVERGNLNLTSTITGRLEAGTTHRLRLLPDAYTGPFAVDRIHIRDGQVRAGDTILTIDATRIDEAIETATRQLTDQQRRLAHAQQELPIMKERHAMQLRQHEIAYTRAHVDLDLWNSYRGPAMLKNAELAVRSWENSVSNQREELEQLEQMYEGVELDSATKEIVLERARRSLAIAEDRLVMTRNDRLITVEHTHPRQTEDHQNTLTDRRQALEHLRINNAIALARKEAEIESLENSIDETERRLTRLRSDREQFIIRAPASGLMTRIDLETGDTVNARHVIATVHDPAGRILRTELTAADLRIISEGDSIDLRVPEFPELSLTGTVASISPLGRARSDETIFDAEVHVDGDDPLIRLGLRITGRAERTIQNVLMIPRNAITERDGRHSVKIALDSDDAHEERAITIGAANDQSVHVISGLSAGDRIILPNGK